MLPSTSRVAAKALGRSANLASTAPKALGAAPMQVHGKRTRMERTGPAMRSGYSGVKATVFGAYGFTGRYLINMLGNEGTTCVIPYRGDDMEWRHLKPLGDYGQIVPVPFDPHNEDSIRRAIGDSDVVVNLMGKDFETAHFLPWMTNWSYEQVNIDLAERVARIAVEHGASVMVHTSALAANPRSRSRWAASKGHGERAVRSVCPGATIVRPAHIFGPEDRFLNMFARMHQLLPRVPLVDGGERRTQPLWVGDFALALKEITLSEDPEVCLGQTYDLAGPDEYTYREIVEYVFETVRAVNHDVANVSPVFAEAVGKALSMLPNPMFTEDTFQRMMEDCILDPTADTKRLHDLRIEATSMEFPGFSFLHGYRSGSHFLDVHESGHSPS